MTTSEAEMGDSTLVGIVDKTNPMYHSGHEIGSNGREPPMDLNIVTRPKQKKKEDPLAEFLSKDRDPFKEILDLYTTNIFTEEIKDKRRPAVEIETDPAKASFRQGYLDGLTHFMQSRGIDVSSTDFLFQGVSVIKTDDGLVGFVRGVRLEEPNIPRNYDPARRRDKFTYTIEYESPLFAEARFRNLTTQEGYRLGFIVGAAREHGVMLKNFQVPMDNNSYTAFMQGIKGEARPIPFEGLIIRPSKYLNFSKEDDPVTSTYEWFDGLAYNAGLQIWLKSQGVQGVKTWAIRHPEALRAFKAALSGQTLPEYEPKPIKLDFGSIRDSLDKKYYLITYNYDKKKFLDELKEPTPAEIARQQGQMGYNLGKAAVLNRK